MSHTLITPDSQAKSHTRPKGTSFLGLVGVELRRLWWRRLTKAVLVGVVAFTGLMVYNVYNQSSPETLAQRLDDYRAMVADAERQIDRQIGGDPGILGNPEFRRLMVGDRGIQPDLAIVAEPVVVQMIAQPFAPVALHGHAAPDREHRKRQAGGGQRHEAHRLGPQLRRIAPADGIEEIAVPEIDPVLGQQLQQHRCDQRGCDRPRLP